MEYITAKQVIGKLRQGGVSDISEAYFSQLVRSGHIPYHTIPGKKRKLYIYDEAKSALLDVQDPRRDPQREAVARQKAERAAQKRYDVMAKDFEEAHRIVILMRDMTLDEYRAKITSAPEGNWQGETVEECYRIDKETAKANDRMLEILGWYLDAVKQQRPATVNELDRIAKETIMYGVLPSEFFTIEPDSLPGAGKISEDA